MSLEEEEVSEEVSVEAEVSVEVAVLSVEVAVLSVEVAVLSVEVVVLSVEVVVLSVEVVPSEEAAVLSVELVPSEAAAVLSVEAAVLSVELVPSSSCVGDGLGQPAPSTERPSSDDNVDVRTMSTPHDSWVRSGLSTSTGSARWARLREHARLPRLAPLALRWANSTEWASENLERLVLLHAIRSVHALPSGASFTLSTAAGDLDLLGDVPGLGTYEVVVAHASELELDLAEIERIRERSA